MKALPVLMVNWRLEKPKPLALPLGYSFRMFRRGEERLWAEIETAAGEFPDLSSALSRFQREFGPYPDEMEQRCVFLLHEGRVIGTATAWYRNSESLGKYGVDSLPEGRLHWVAIHPDFQGRGLARPLVSEAVRLLCGFYDSAYLTSQTTSFKAIKIYLDYGFVPVLTAPGAKEAWRLLARLLPHPLLKNLQRDLR